jgi:hypothetical protein
VRALLHLVSFVLLLPGLVFAAGFAILGRAIAGVTLWGLVDRLAADALWLLSWGIYAIAAILVAILIGGFFVQTRWLAALAVAVLSIASAIVLIALGSHPFAEGQWQFLVPGLVALIVSGWLAVEGWPAGIR